jgi:hypothetical protein
MARDQEQCPRCREWEQMGLSAYCPSCDAAYYDEPRADHDDIDDGEVRCAACKAILSPGSYERHVCAHSY